MTERGGFIDLVITLCYEGIGKKVFSNGGAVGYNYLEKTL